MIIATRIVRCGEMPAYTAAWGFWPTTRRAYPHLVLQMKSQTRTQATSARSDAMLKGDAANLIPKWARKSWTLGITAPDPNSLDSGDCWPGLMRTLTRR
jgi:hypothetical protein